MAGEETNHKNEEIEREDITDRLAQLSSSLFDGTENVDALIEQANSPENASIFEQMLINVPANPYFPENERHAEAAAMQILLHLQGHGATVGDIDGFRGTNTNDAFAVWREKHLEFNNGNTEALRSLALFNRQERFAKVMKIEDNTMLASNADMKLMENADKAKEYLQEKLAADTSGTLTLGKEISAMALAVQILLQKAGNNPQGLDGHVGGKTLAAAKAFAESQGIDWDGVGDIPNAVLRRLVGEENAPQTPVTPRSETANIATNNSNGVAEPVVLQPVNRTDEVAAASAQSPEIFTAGGTTEVNNENLNEALTAASTELAKDNANKSWVEALLNAIFGLGPNNLSPNKSQGAAGMLGNLVDNSSEVTDTAQRATSLDNLAHYNLREYQRLNDNTATAGQAATHASSALRYANQTLELIAAEDNSIAQEEVTRLETSARNILAQLSSVPRFEPGEVQNMFDTVTTLDVDLDDAHIDGAGIPDNYIEGSDVKYEELQEALLGRFGLDSSEIESTIFNAELEERTLEVMKRIAIPAFQQIFSQYAVDGNRGTAWEKVRLLAGRKPGASASNMTSDEETNIATSIDSMDKEDVLELVGATRVMEGIRNLAKIEEASRNIALRELIDEHLGHVVDVLPDALPHSSAFDAESVPGFNNLALFFAQQEVLDPHQSARELFLLLADHREDIPRDSEDMLAADTGNIFKQALEAFTNQNPAAAAALLQAESYEQLFGTPPAEGGVTPAELRQREEMSQNYINNARNHALKQLRLTRDVVDGFVTGMFDGVPGDVNDKAEDAFTAMIARLEDTENHPNYVLDIPFGASIDAVAKPEDPQNTAILENWEQEKHILGIRVSSEFDTNQFGSKLMGAIHGTQNSTDWDFGVNNISGTNEYLISVKPDGKLHTALQESGANPATWELALREIVRAGMQHTQIEGEFFNPRTAHRRGMEAFEQQEKNEEMEQLRISERFLRNHEARASSLEINGETISTFAIERQVEGETYYVHVANVSGTAIEAMPSGLGTARVFVTKQIERNEALVHEGSEIAKVLSLNANNDEVFPEEAQKLYRFNETRPAVVQYNADHLRVDGEIIPTASYAYLGYVLHIAKRNRNNNYEEGFTPPSNFASRDADTDADYEVFLTKKGDNANVQTETLPLITDALLIERATRAVEQHLSGEAEAEEERTADFLDLFHHHSSHYEEAKEPEPRDGTATEFQHAIFEEINTSFAEIDGTDYFVLDLEEAPSDIRVHLENAFQKDNKLYVPITGNKIPPVVVVTEDLPGGYKHEFLAVGDGKRPQALVDALENVEPTASLKTAPLVRHVHIAGQTAPDRVEASSAE